MNKRKIALITPKKVYKDRPVNDIVETNHYLVFISQCLGTDENSNIDWALHGEQLGMENMDYTLMYVPTQPHLETILETRQLDSDKLFYMMCDCGIDKWKTPRVQVEWAGNPDAKFLEVDCTGFGDMQMILSMMQMPEKGELESFLEYRLQWTIDLMEKRAHRRAEREKNKYQAW